MSEWKSEQMQRFASEAKWDQEDYDHLVASWYHEQAPLRGDNIPSRAVSNHDNRAQRPRAQA